MDDVLATTVPGKHGGGQVTAIARGSRFGRYVVLERIGAGGMGVVYSAYDPDLDRKVAVKIVRGGSGIGERRARLAREAQALARLAHPNVMVVHDVGEHEGDLFLAMALVEGTTLREWLAKERPWREILAVFLAAGRGLAAAHRAGLVHRDFKPDNVLIRAADGQVIVTDFGLARAYGAPTPREDGGEELTLAGNLLGTPGYLSPEAFRGEPTDARSDQFAFSVSLYEALYRQRPFQATASPGLSPIDALAVEVVAGRVRPPPRKSRVPGRVRQIVLRGLSAAPGARWPSMHELIAALERDPGRRLRTAALGVGGAVLFAASVLVARGSAPQAAACSAGEERLVGVWDDAVRSGVRQAFAATGRGNAEDTFARVAGRLDRYTADWRAMRRDACEATSVRREQSAELLDLRMACLDRRLASLAALTQAWRRGPGAAGVDRAVLAAAGLADLAGCADAEALRAAYPPPSEPARRAWRRALAGRLDQAEALRATGRRNEALAAAVAGVVEARSLGHPPAVADALALEARIRSELADPAAAMRAIEEALAATAEARDDVETARLLALLVFVAGTTGTDIPRALAVAPLARAALRRAGDPPSLAGMLDHHLAITLAAAGRWEEARAAEEAAIARRTAVHGADSPELVSNHVTLGDALRGQGRHADGEVALRRAIALGERTLGPEHPRVIAARNGLGNLAHTRGDFDEAMRQFQWVLGASERVLGADSPFATTAAGNVAMIHQAAGRYDEAARLTERALAAREKRLGPDHPEVALTLYNLAACRFRQGRAAEAEAQLRRAVAIHEKLPGTERMLAIMRDGLGQLHLATGRIAEAVRILEGAQHADLPGHRVHLAEALLAAGRAREARAQVEPVLAAIDATPQARDRAAARLVLAHTGPRQLLDEAEAILAAAPPDEGEIRGSSELRKRLAEARRLHGR